MTPTERAHQLIELVNDLVNVMERENELLKTPRPGGLDVVVKEKLALVSLYEGHLKEVAKDPDFKESLEPSLREALRAIAVRFNAAREANEVRLKSAIETSHKVIDAVAAAAQTLNPKASGYGAAGSAKEAQANIPLAIDREL